MWLAVIFFFAILGLLLYLDTVKPKNFPPGPKWLPLLGAALEVRTMVKKTEGFTFAAGDLAAKYGPVLGMRLGRETFVVVYGAKENREFMLNEDLIGRPIGPFYTLRTKGYRRGLLTNDSLPWTEQRRFLLRQLKDFGFGRRGMSDYMSDEGFAMVNHLKGQMGKDSKVEVQMDSMFGVHVLNSLWTMLASTKYSPVDERLVGLQNGLTQLFKNIHMIGAPFSHFPVLRYIIPELSGYNLYMDSHRPIWEFVEREIKEHKKTFVPGTHRDVMDVYLDAIQSPDTPSHFDDHQLLAICIDLFIAGSETTAKTLGFCFLYLLLHPEIQKKAQEEIDRVIGLDRMPTIDDRRKMPYNEAVALEAIRHFMGRTLSVPHRAMKDCKLAGYDIPKDTMVLSSFHGLLLDKEWAFTEDPLGFHPERFIDADGQLKVPDEYIPFGIGKRRCLGETLARGNVFVLTTSMLQHFDIKQVPGQPKPSTISVDGCTAGTAPFRAIVQLRQH